MILIQKLQLVSFLIMVSFVRLGDQIASVYYIDVFCIISNFIFIEMPERKEKLKELRDIVQNNCVQNKKLEAVKAMQNRLLNLYGLEENDFEQIDPKQIIQVIVLSLEYYNVITKVTIYFFKFQEYKQALSEIDVDVSNDKELIEFDKHVEALSGKPQLPIE